MNNCECKKKSVFIYKQNLHEKNEKLQSWHETLGIQEREREEGVGGAY